MLAGRFGQRHRNVGSGIGAVYEFFPFVGEWATFGFSTFREAGNRFDIVHALEHRRSQGRGAPRVLLMFVLSKFQVTENACGQDSGNEEYYDEQH
jgi:hypothetical protein